ncbi:MAG: hypothetical protein HRT89_15930 [Lentisphaeria bacterium]|nr:hypothetical protein [Lentisphaeria bacterium]
MTAFYQSDCSAQAVGGDFKIKVKIEDDHFRLTVKDYAIRAEEQIRLHLPFNNRKKVKLLHIHDKSVTVNTTHFFIEYGIKKTPQVYENIIKALLFRRFRQLSRVNSFERKRIPQWLVAAIYYHVEQKKKYTPLHASFISTRIQNKLGNMPKIETIMNKCPSMKTPILWMLSTDYNASIFHLANQHKRFFLSSYIINYTIEKSPAENLSSCLNIDLPVWYKKEITKFNKHNTKLVTLNEFASTLKKIETVVIDEKEHIIASIIFDKEKKKKVNLPKFFSELKKLQFSSPYLLFRSLGEFYREYQNLILAKSNNLKLLNRIREKMAQELALHKEINTYLIKFEQSTRSPNSILAKYLLFIESTSKKHKAVKELESYLDSIQKKYEESFRKSSKE